MSTAHVTNNVQNGTLADANAIMTNYNDILAFLNTLVVHEDGSIPMTGALTLQGNVTSALHAVPYQQHEDGPSALSMTVLQLATASGSTAAANAYSTYDATLTVPASGRAVSISAQFTGQYIVDVSTGTVSVKLQYSVDGTTWVDGRPITSNMAGDTVGANHPIACSVGASSVTPNTTIRVRCQFKGTGTANARIQTGEIHLLVVPA